MESSVIEKISNKLENKLKELHPTITVFVMNKIDNLKIICSNKKEAILIKEKIIKDTDLEIKNFIKNKEIIIEEDVISIF